MDELKKINAIISKKQIGRIVGGIGSIIIGTILIGRFAKQKGITDYQKFISNTYPDEYEEMTAKVVEMFERH